MASPSAFDPVSLLTGLGGSLLGGVLGSNRKPSAAELAQAALAQKQAQLASTLGGYGADEHAKYAAADQTAQRQVRQYADLLGQNPNTDQARTQAIGQATAGTNNAYESGKSNLAAILAQRGITDGSAANGGFAAIENARAGDISHAYNDRYGQEQADRYNRAGMLTSLLSGNAANYNSNAQGYYGQAMGGNSSAFGMYGNVAQQEDARNAANAQQQQANASSMGQLAGMLSSGGGGGRAASPGGYTPPFAPVTPSGVGTTAPAYRYNNPDTSNLMGLPLAPRQTRKVNALGY